MYAFGVSAIKNGASELRNCVSKKVENKGHFWSSNGGPMLIYKQKAWTNCDSAGCSSFSVCSCAVAMTLCERGHVWLQNYKITCV